MCFLLHKCKITLGEEKNFFKYYELSSSVERSGSLKKVLKMSVIDRNHHSPLEECVEHRDVHT